MQAEMDEEKLRTIHNQHVTLGCFLDWAEWKEKVADAYSELIRIAREGRLITYGELGIGTLRIPLDWLYLEIGWIAGACSDYECMESRPLISAVVVNKVSGRPGKRFWALQGIPSRLRISANIGDWASYKIDLDQDEFWVKEVGKVYKQWR